VAYELVTTIRHNRQTI